MYLLYPIVAAIASAGVVASPLQPEYAPRPHPQGPACVGKVKDQCLDGVKHRDGILSQAGCTITAELQCQAQPVLPEYAPAQDLLKHALTWSPPANCKAEWDKCINEISIPFFNRPVCAQYLPILCKGKLKDHEEEAQVDQALTMLYRDFSATLDFFYDHVPASKAIKFDRCIATTHMYAHAHGMNSTNGTASTSRTGPGLQVFFKCLAEAKNNTSTSYDKYLRGSMGPWMGPWIAPLPPQSDVKSTGSVSDKTHLAARDEEHHQIADNFLGNPLAAWMLHKTTGFTQEKTEEESN